jgi:hypothetical protein
MPRKFRALSSYHRRHMLNEAYFAEIDTPEKAYWLGFLAADGCVRDGRRAGVRLVLKTADRAHVEKFRRAIGHAAPLSYPIMSCRGVLFEQCSCEVHSHRLAADLVRHGVTPRKSLTLRPWVAPSPTLQACWFAGLFDGDGSVCWSASSGCAVLSLVGTRDVLSAFVTFFCPERNPTLQSVGRVWRLNLNGHHLVAGILATLYEASPVWLDRKKERADKIRAEAIGRRPSRRDWSWLTADHLLSLHAEHERWCRVATFLGLSRRAFYQHKRRLGL